ncbi:hypothetical protein Xen7305DRAFT_00036910 [Xenococcus sp. PCC 7305]|uniref:DUF1802 family protein n=1 Tax=Xenococcus sp. PCC 7305 TaxID=102125 RepID=UPI0002AC0D74|nr:DUF1802 family protein [Xenococcus sp. PCC 7305]ELS03965.1 hypothetical protein Xen7305DRAFT_00036910 [Xenococcus sp. PCC 7305]
MIGNTKTLTHAFKEWAIAVEALATGKTIILLRKGGIREAAQKFQVQHQQVWLYPTYEHQKPHLLKSEYSDKVTIVESGWHPETVTIRTYAQITQTLSVTKSETLQALQPYHIWNEQMIRDRLKWKASQPLSVLFLRVYNLPRPLSIPYDSSYGGCKSWIDLVKPISLQGLNPILDDHSYQKLAREIVGNIN